MTLAWHDRLEVDKININIFPTVRTEVKGNMAFYCTSYVAFKMATRRIIYALLQV